MPAIAAPYGLVPVRRRDGLPATGALTTYNIASGAAAMFRGSPVRINTANGTVVPVTSSVMGTSPRDMYVGVFNGCEYTDATGNRVHSNFFPNGTVTSDAVAYVIDDPNVVFKIQAQAADFNALAARGQRFEISQFASGNTVTGRSTARLDTAAGAGDTKPYVVVGIYNAPDNPNASGFVDVEVTINTNIHVYER